MTVTDVFMRFAFNSPIAGVNELSALSLAMITGLCLGWCALEKAHVKVDLLMDRLPKKIQFIIDSIVLIMSFIMVGIISVWTISELWLKKGQITGSLKIPIVPFEWIFWAGMVVFLLCILLLIIKHFSERITR